MRARRELVNFKLRLAALTPFTVGSGRTLNRFDFSLTVNPRSGTPLIRVLDVERFIDEGKIPPEKKVEAIEKRQSGTLDRFSRYVLSCQFREARETIELIEFQRDAAWLPVVPASALRGLLRTAVAFAYLKTQAGRLREGVEAAMEGRWKREGAAQRLERGVFGRSQEDLFKALRIGEPQGVSNEDLRAYEISVMNLAGSGLVPKLGLCVEAMNPRAGVAFEYDLVLDRALLAGAGGEEAVSGGRPPAAGAPPAGAPTGGGPTAGAAKAPAAPAGERGRRGPPTPAGAGAHLEGPDRLLAALRSFSDALIDGERRFYFEASAREAGRLFDECIRRAEGKIALPFGFGAGWRSKTVGALLGPGELQRLAPLLAPGRVYYRRGPRPIFPKTRRWVLDHGRPAEPLGWVVIE